MSDSWVQILFFHLQAMGFWSSPLSSLSLSLLSCRMRDLSHRVSMRIIWDNICNVQTWRKYSSFHPHLGFQTLVWLWRHRFASHLLPLVALNTASMPFKDQNENNHRCLLQIWELLWAGVLSIHFKPFHTLASESLCVVWLYSGLFS